MRIKRIRFADFTVDYLTPKQFQAEPGICCYFDPVGMIRQLPSHRLSTNEYGYEWEEER